MSDCEGEKLSFIVIGWVVFVGFRWFSEGKSRCFEGKTGCFFRVFGFFRAKVIFEWEKFLRKMGGK